MVKMIHTTENKTKKTTNKIPPLLLASYAAAFYFIMVCPYDNNSSIQEHMFLSQMPQQIDDLSFLSYFSAVRNELSKHNPMIQLES